MAKRSARRIKRSKKGRSRNVYKRKSRRRKTRRVHRRKTRKMRGGAERAWEAIKAHTPYGIGKAIGDQMTKIKCDCPLDNCSAREPTGMGGYQAMVHGVLPTHAPGKCDAIWDRGFGSSLRQMGAEVRVLGGLATVAAGAAPMEKPSVSQADIDQHDWLIGYGGRDNAARENRPGSWMHEAEDDGIVNFCNRCYRHMIQEARKDETKDTLRDKIAGLLDDNQAEIFVNSLESTEYPDNKALFNGPSPKQVKELFANKTGDPATDHSKLSSAAAWKRDPSLQWHTESPNWNAMNKAMAPELMGAAQPPE